MYTYKTMKKYTYEYVYIYNNCNCFTPRQVEVRQLPVPGGAGHPPHSEGHLPPHEDILYAPGEVQTEHFRNYDKFVFEILLNQPEIRLYLPF